MNDRLRDAVAQPVRGSPPPSAQSRVADEPRLPLEPPTVSLPKGGGAIRGIDESFSVNSSNGTASLSLSLPLSPGRSGSVPPVRMLYSSGAGNSVAGLGWSIEFPSIRRRTDRLLPSYRDTADTFLLHGAEDLVPASTWTGGQWVPETPISAAYAVRRYRPRIEGDFARIERIAHPALGTWWRVISRDNVTTFYGIDDATRISDPNSPGRVFHWLPALSFDDQGNCLVYEYKPEDLAAVSSTLSEANRRKGTALFANKHLKRLYYGNRVPHFADEDDPYRPGPVAGDFLFQAVFDYGEHDPLQPTPAEAVGRPWPVRPDPFSSHRSGFEIRTYRLLRRVLMFHKFDELAGGAPCLVRSLDLTYASSSAGSPQASEVTYLKAATQCGYSLKPDGSYARRTLPPVEFDYEPLNWHTQIATVDRESVANLPSGAAGDHEWIDLLGEGIAGLFAEQPGAWFYKANLGDVDEDGKVRLDVQREVMPKPSFTGTRQGTLQFRDLDGDGRNQIVVHTPEMQGYFDPGDGGEWLPFRSFDAAVRIDLLDRNLRMLDLDGDGRADLLITEEDALVWYHADKRGYQPAQRTLKPDDEERGPAIVFSEAEQTIFLADMTGDGLIDIVRIRNRDICYWPNLGYGRFGAKVAMDHAPTFAPPDLFDARYLHLADVSGTGTSDVLYLSPNGCTAYLNLSGNAWSDAQPVTPFFPTEQPNRLAITDLLGNGTACIVWSSTLPAHAEAPMRYLDLMGGKKPHLLRKYVNNLGKEVSFSYKSSTWYYLKDKVEGQPWATRLPFPVHCLRRVEVRDRTAGSRFSSEFRYRHGYYDRTEREFRGFGMVEQRDAESFEGWATSSPGRVVDASLYQTPILTRTWFHTGAPSDRAEILTRFRDEYWDREMARHGFAVAATEPALPDARLVLGPGVDPDALTPLRPEDWREALRACKGMVLRTEAFGLDAPSAGATDAERQRQHSPYTVAAHNCVIELLQPVLGAEHAVFVVKESEVVTWNYERDLANPRVEHKLNVAVDEYGNVLESASVVYGRANADPALAPAVRGIQARSYVKYVRTELTNDALDAARYRLRRPSRATAFEIVGLPRPGALYTIGDFSSAAFHVLNDSLEIPFHDEPAPPQAGTVYRRRLRCKETLFYDDALEAALPLHILTYNALPYETYELAFTPDLLGDIFSGRATNALMSEGGYVHRDDDAWWVPSGRWEYLAEGETAVDARDRFFVPVAHVDAFGARTSIGYLADYFLLRNSIVDAAHNRTRVDEFDLRTQAPVRIIDPNGNISEVILDELGWVKACAVRGKGTEADDLAGLTTWAEPGDDAARDAFLAAPTSVELSAAGKTLLRRASVRFVYDPQRYIASGGTTPPMSAMITREQYAAVLPDAPVQISFEYSNGMGKVELHKMQAEPGTAKRVTLLPGDAYALDVVDTSTTTPPRLRWLGTGRKILNNKGNPVKEYEPFFSASHAFESEKELVESGVTLLKSYDPVDRVVRVDYPDGTFSRTEFGPWKVAAYDRNDTVLESAWYRRRINHEIDAALTAAGKDPVREAEAAAQTADHAATPLTRHFDPFGRPTLDVEHDGLDDANQALLYSTIHVRDVDGNVLEIEDARGNTTMTYEHDMRGRIAAHRGMDCGPRWMLDNVLGNPVRSWDGRNHEFVFAYDDPLHRPTSKKVLRGDGPAPLDRVFERIVYGEGRPNDSANNLRARVALLYDTAGRVENVSFDLKGSLTASSRRFCKDPKAIPDWSGSDPDAQLLAETFQSSATYDALDRVAQRTTADGSVYLPSYNAGNLLEGIRITQGATTEIYVSNIDYNEKGRRQRIVFGNGVATTYRYDAETFRLLRLTSVNKTGDPLQDLVYTYDPAGNATHLEDRAIPTVWFDNQVVTGLSTYRHTPTYRLAEATGREHAGQVDFGSTDNWADSAFFARCAAGDPLVWRNYEQTYAYDAVGNLTEIAHVAAGGNWTRGFSYAPDSNRLTETQVGAASYPYSHHPVHGYMDAMPHLTVMRWNFRDELQAVSTQAVTSGTPPTTWYVYDGQGKRVRKITERAADEGAIPARASERYYLDGVDIYREYSGAGAVSLERKTLEVVDDRQRVALIETEDDSRLVRFQGVDHLQSAHLETDEDGRVISYEEFHPFGTTAYQAVDKNIVAAAKRYRYTGMERDEESGLEYHSARYYAPWLARWTAPDLHADQVDGNRYAYVKNNPIIARDSNGMFDEPTHGVLTYRLALAAGIPWKDAARIAIATAGMDHDAATSPAQPGQVAAFSQIDVTERLHFSDALADVKSDIASQRGKTRHPDDLEKFGRHLHTLEDVGFADAPGPHMRHDKGKPVVRVLGGTIAMLGFIAAGFGLFGLAASVSGSSVVGALLSTLLLGFGIYLIALGFRTRNIGHPSYHTERGEESSAFKHTADQAPQDPVANTKEMLKIYGLLKEYARARYGRKTFDDKAAAAAIREDIAADNSCLISNFANRRPLDFRKQHVASYSQILSTRPAGQWAPGNIDATLPEGKGDWRFEGTPGKTAVCPAH